jgi:hypothetical protein
MSTRTTLKRFALCALITACGAEPTSPSGHGGSSSASGNGSGGTSNVPIGNAGTTPATGGTSSPGTAGSSNPIAGGGGSAPVGTGGSAGGSAVPVCTTKIAMKTPGIADFEGYDGVVAPSDFQWIFGGSMPGELGVHAGTYAFGDGSVEPVLALLAGHGGNYGLTVSVTNATKWGEGFGLFLLDDKYEPACVDASMYKGISMWVRGSVPTSTFSFSVTVPEAVPAAKGGTCSGADDTTCKPPTAQELPIGMTWTQVSLTWADFTGGLSGAATPITLTGGNITGLSFGANLTFVPETEGSMVYVPVAGDVSVAIDDLTFIP